ncbi:iron-regulated transporter 1 [Striga asiatica]|uniref:Iron-regulated transporter 1 n=1 Tax=Striga asiatica TaxID=4170 RepID=A0A5A7QJX0_STRAF|nr:iron-regulated transporter 1 [Striga asiatica]
MSSAYNKQGGNMIPRGATKGDRRPETIELLSMRARTSGAMQKRSGESVPRRKGQRRFEDARLTRRGIDYLQPTGNEAKADLLQSVLCLTRYIARCPSSYLCLLLSFTEDSLSFSSPLSLDRQALYPFSFDYFRLLAFSGLVALAGKQVLFRVTLSFIDKGSGLGIVELDYGFWALVR